MRKWSQRKFVWTLPNRRGFFWRQFFVEFKWALHGQLGSNLWIVSWKRFHSNFRTYISRCQNHQIKIQDWRILRWFDLICVSTRIFYFWRQTFVKFKFELSVANQDRIYMDWELTKVPKKLQDLYFKMPITSDWNRRLTCICPKFLFPQKGLLMNDEKAPEKNWYQRRLLC